MDDKGMMQAVIVRAPGRYGVEQVEIPACPDEGLLLRVEACGLCGSDLRTLRSGHHRISLPWIIGHEVCGQVRATGSRYAGPWSVGQRLAVSPVVYCRECVFCKEEKYELCTGYRELAQHWPGGLAEFMTLPGDVLQRGTLREVSSSMDSSAATLVEPLSSVVNAQEKGAVGEGDTVVIIGAGPIGSLHLYLARARKASRIIVIDISSERLVLMEADPVDELIHAENLDPVDEVRRLTGGLGASVVITANPVPETQVQAVEMVRKGGRVLLFGGLPPDKACPGINMNTVHYGALHLIGTTIFAPRHHGEALRLLAEGLIPAGRIISHTFPLEQFCEGAGLALAGRARKVVFTI